MIIKIIWYHYTSPAISDSRNFRNSEPQVTTLCPLNTVFCPVSVLTKFLNSTISITLWKDFSFLYLLIGYVLVV